MLRHGRHPIFAVAGLVLLACFGFASVEAWAGHTDDGCRLDLHCFACRWALASTALVALPATIGVALAEMGAVAQNGNLDTVESPVPTSASRGPP